MRRLRVVVLQTRRNCKGHFRADVYDVHEGSPSGFKQIQVRLQ